VTGGPWRKSSKLTPAGGGGATAVRRSGISAADAVTRLTEVFKTNYPDWAANTDWPNLNSMTGFVNRLYAEIRE
jgi:hypothetical protein